MKRPLPQATSGRSLADQVYSSLRTAILEGYFEPGEKLDQGLISEELDVSLTPIREALKVLETEGFIKLRPHRGAYVTRVSQQDIMNVYEIRAILEAEAVRQAVPLIPEGVLEEMEGRIRTSAERFAAGERTAHLESDEWFHHTFHSYVENDLIMEILDSLGDRISRVRRFALVQPGAHLRDSFEEHLKIIEAASRRDAEGAAEAMRTHLERSAVRIQEISAAEQVVADGAQAA